jgi:hypothetical protein
MPPVTKVEEYLQSVDATKKIGIIAGIGDRRDEDIKECASIAARIKTILSSEEKAPEEEKMK